jgi:hypothetical protein
MLSTAGAGLLVSSSSRCAVLEARVLNQLIDRMLERPRSSQSKREARVFLQLLKQVEDCSGKVAWDTTFSCLTALHIGP